MPLPKSWDLLKDFMAYCIDHPGERFWQALRNWSKWAFIYASGSYDAGHIDRTDLCDTFSWEKAISQQEWEQQRSKAPIDMGNPKAFMCNRPARCPNPHCNRVLCEHNKCPLVCSECLEKNHYEPVGG